MDHVSLAVVLPLLHEALASSPLEWSPAPAVVGDICMKATAPTHNGLIVNYLLNLTDDTSRAAAGAISVSLHREVVTPFASKNEHGLLVIRAAVATFVQADWVPTAETTDLATIISKLFVDAQETAATLILKADAVSNV